MIIADYLVAYVPEDKTPEDVIDSIMRTYPEKYTHCEYSKMNEGRTIEIRAYLKLKRTP